MKQGRGLQDIAKALEHQVESRKDYVAPQAALSMGEDATLRGLNGNPLELTNHAHGQLATHLEIPQKYYDRMKAEQPALLANNVNTWLAKAPEERRMVRTLDGQARAFLSAKYRPLDNYDLATAVLPVLQERGVQVMSAELTETRMYIKGILPDLSDPLPEGLAYGEGHHGVNGEPIGQAMVKREGRLVAAIVISNSEVGAGSLRVEPSVFTTWCTNLAIIAQAAMRKYHVGRSTDAAEDFTVFHDDTRKADDAAFWLKVRDVTLAAFDRKTFEAAIASIREAAGKPIEAEDLTKVVEVATKRLALTEGLQGSILTQLARGGDLSQWGLSSAITAAANQHPDYEMATELERAGGKVLALSAGDWKAISQAA